MSQCKELNLSFNNIKLTSGNIDDDKLDFYLKLLDDDNKALCSFGMDGYGIYYTKRGHQNNSGFLSMERLKDLFESLLKFDLINGEDDSALQISTEDNRVVIMKSGNKKKKPVWKRIKNAETIGVEEFEQWLNDMEHEPYLYDTFLLSIDWVKTLTEAIEKV